LIDRVSQTAGDATSGHHAVGKRPETLSTSTLFVVLCGALLHAAWNTLLKASGRTERSGAGDGMLVDTALVAAGGAATALPVLLALGLAGMAPAAASWPFIAASSVIQVGYFGLVAAAYRSGDMSLAYPIMRGTAPLLTAGFGRLVLGEAPSALALAGIVAISAGVLGMAAGRQGAANRRSILAALANAVVIATYTVIDGAGARRSGSAMAYTMVIFVLAALMFVPLVARRHGGALRVAVRERWRMALIGGSCVTLSYGLALWAMTRAPVATVAALRESSIVFAMILAAVVLREKIGFARVAGGGLIVVGAVALRLG
jgi:drug/metabolite transporter (DMT)-like permease